MKIYWRKGSAPLRTAKYGPYVFFYDLVHRIPEERVFLVCMCFTATVVAVLWTSALLFG